MSSLSRRPCSAAKSGYKSNRSETCHNFAYSTSRVFSAASNNGTRATGTLKAHLNSLDLLERQELDQKWLKIRNEAYRVLHAIRSKKISHCKPDVNDLHELKSILRTLQRSQKETKESRSIISNAKRHDITVAHSGALKGNKANFAHLKLMCRLEIAEILMSFGRTKESCRELELIEDEELRRQSTVCTNLTLKRILSAKLARIYLKMDSPKKAIKLCARFLPADNNDSKFCLARCKSLILACISLNRLGQCDESLSLMRLILGFKDDKSHSQYVLGTLKPLIVYLTGFLLNCATKTWKGDLQCKLDTMNDYLSHNFALVCTTAVQYWSRLSMSSEGNGEYQTDGSHFFIDLFKRDLQELIAVLAKIYRPHIVYRWLKRILERVESSTQFEETDGGPNMKLQQIIEYLDVMEARSCCNPDDSTKVKDIISQ